METLKQTNMTLISTLDEVMKIQEDGRQKRKAAEAELAQLEQDIKTQNAGDGPVKIAILKNNSPRRVLRFRSPGASVLPPHVFAARNSIFVSGRWQPFHQLNGYGRFAAAYYFCFLL